jgi:hypothetical protein
MGDALVLLKCGLLAYAWWLHDGTSVRYLQLKPANRVFKKAGQRNTFEPTFSLIQLVLLQLYFQ